VTRVWYCRNCGYEVTSRGRCHACREKLTASELPELPAGSEDDEVGYRLNDWDDADRGRLIERLNELGILHRFEDDELVVDAGDESQVDDLVAMVAASVPDGSGDLSGEVGAAVGAGSPPTRSTTTDPAVGSAVQLLADAAARLSADPTDMQADADVAEASAAVFMVDQFGSLDEDTWLAVGRVTRSLLALLGADEALEAEIRQEARILAKLLAPLSEPGHEAVLELSVSEESEESDESDEDESEDSEDDEDEQTVYELPEWLPEQRAHLSLLLEDAEIAYEWDLDELVVPAERETEVEDLFTRVGGTIPGEEVDGGEARYQAVAELFAACGRLAGDPGDEEKAALVVQWAHESDGPPLLGMDDVDWFRIRTRAKALLACIEQEDDYDHIRDEANALHDMLRSFV
jgi:hypothetical protein